LHEVLKAYNEGGYISSGVVAEGERELLRSRVRTLRLETEYRDALDQFNLRFDAAAERLNEIEERSILPLTRHLRRFDEIGEEYKSAVADLERSAEPEKAAETRTLFRRCLTGCVLVKGTKFGEQFVAQWAEWEKLADLTGTLRNLEVERRELLTNLNVAEARGEAPQQATVRRLDEIRLRIDIGRLERSLRAHEGRPWEEEKDEARRLARRQVHLQELRGACQVLLTAALQDSLARHAKSWPDLAPVRLQGVDLLACDLERAERLVAATSEKREAAASRKKWARKVRELAEAYRIQRRLFEISFLQVRDALGLLATPPQPTSPHETVALSGRLRESVLSLEKSKRELLTSWVEYQMARLDLYRELELTPP
jgi:hypothetical protein